MQRARLIAPLILLALGLHSCRRTSWKIVAEPVPAHPLLEQPVEATPAGDESVEESSTAPVLMGEVKLLGRTAQPSAAGTLEGHVVGAVQAQALPARGKQ